MNELFDTLVMSFSMMVLMLVLVSTCEVAELHVYCCRLLHDCTPPAAHQQNLSLSTSPPPSLTIFLSYDSPASRLRQSIGRFAC